jgi:hypothetical protein
MRLGQQSLAVGEALGHPVVPLFGRRGAAAPANAAIVEVTRRIYAGS